MNFLNEKGLDKWQDVGVYPTPFNLLEEFSEFVLNNVSNRERVGDDERHFEILDIFSGDGRIGKIVSENIEMRCKTSTNVTFIEAIKASLAAIEVRPNFTFVNQNVFESKNKKKYDLVVSNPPYLVLNSNSSESLGINWNLARKYSKNLYALSILKGLEMCRKGGVMCVIAPFGYLRGYESVNFKEEIEKECSDVKIKASPMRTLFEGVNQDVGFQCFYKRDDDAASPTNWSFGYNGYSVSTISTHTDVLPKSSISLKLAVRVRVGPIVWNRTRVHLAATNDNGKNSILVYGANIRHNGDLDLKIKKLSNRQFIKVSGISNNDLIKRNAILLRRTLRGSPGKWIVDSTIIIRSARSFTAENHVIIVELEEFSSYAEIDSFRKDLCRKIEEYYFISGSPTISTKVVNSIVKRHYSSLTSPSI